MPHLSQYQQGWGRRKPAPWARVNGTHPLARGPLSLCCLFNEGGGKARDISPSSNLGTLNSGASWVPGLFSGAAIKFDGSTGAVTYASDPSGLTNFSVIAWNYRSAVSGYAPIITAPQPTPVGLFIDANSFLNWFDAADHIGGSALSLNAWHQVGVTSDGTTLRFYLDGQAHGTNAFAATWPTSIQTGSDSGTNLLTGFMDHIVVWPRVLTGAEVNWLFQQPFAFVAQPPPVRFSQGHAAAAGTYVPYDIPHSPQHQTVLAM